MQVDINSRSKNRLVLLAIPILGISLFSISCGELENKDKSFAVNDRISAVGVCEEYNLNLLSESDKGFIKKYFTTGRRCPAENRVGRCLGAQDTDGMIFDKHYYTASAKGFNWESANIRVTCEKIKGAYEDN